MEAATDLHGADSASSNSDIGPDDCEFGKIMFLDLMRDIRSSPTLSVNCDEGDGRVCIRVHFLDSEFAPTTKYFQKEVYQKDHRSLCECIIAAFTESPCEKRVPRRYMLTMRELGMKLIGFTADAASVMGTQQKAMGGDNLATTLTSLKNNYTDEKLFVVWCFPHRLDLVAQKLKKWYSTTSSLEMVHKLVTHVKMSSVAQGKLRAIYDTFMAEETELISSGDVNFVLQRMLSHAKPAKVIVDNFAEVMLYVDAMLTHPGDEAQTNWANSFKDLAYSGAQSFIPNHLHDIANSV